MKVICLVPSWTEMLIKCGIEVVGRTRFCIHPQEQTGKIPVVGGTKDLDWQKVAALQADFLILDQEENLPWMKEQSPLPVIVTHITSVESVAGEIQKMGSQLGTSKLKSVEARWRQIENSNSTWNWKAIPGVDKVLKQDFATFEKLIYVIWKNPWMRAGSGTFISSIFDKLGAQAFWIGSQQKYPHFELADFDLKKTFFLFSSEPFPFAAKEQEKKLLELGVQGALVDGESFSWFGVRSLQFLEKALGCKSN